MSGRSEAGVPSIGGSLRVWGLGVRVYGGNIAVSFAV